MAFDSAEIGDPMNPRSFAPEAKLLLQLPEGEQFVSMVAHRDTLYVCTTRQLFYLVGGNRLLPVAIQQ